jgi:hypothetical protein
MLIAVQHCCCCCQHHPALLLLQLEADVFPTTGDPEPSLQAVQLHAVGSDHLLQAAAASLSRQV